MAASPACDDGRGLVEESKVDEIDVEVGHHVAASGQEPRP